MSESMLRRLSGMALVLSVPLWIAGEAIHPRSEGLADIVGFGQSPSHAILAVAFVFLLLGLPGLYGSHAGRSGVLGLVGYVLMVVFVAYHVYMSLYETGRWCSWREIPAPRDCSPTVAWSNRERFGRGSRLR